MTKQYVHQLSKETHEIAGWHAVQREEQLAHRGKEFLYVVGSGFLQSSCCGTGSCHYAVVPGSIVSWKSGINEDGSPISEVEPVRDVELRKELDATISEREGVNQVQFW